MKIEEQLQELGRDLPIPHVDPSASVAKVARRGRFRMWFTRGVTVAMTLTSGVAAAVVAPQVIDRPTTPTVVGEVDGVTVAPEEERETEVPVRDEKPVVPAPSEDEPEAKDEPKAEEKSEEEKAETPVLVDTSAPEIAVLHPADGTVSDERTIAFEGEVEPGARVFAGGYEADVTDSGAWRIVLVLSQGKNVVTFTAKDDAGNQAKDSVTVHYEPTKDESPTDVRFTAKQVHASKSYDPPYTYYEGTAKPGSVVKVTSEHGSAATEANAKGAWEVKVWFEGAPYGTHTWPVTVKSKATGETRSFEFTGTRPESQDLYLAASQKWNVIDAPFENVYWGTATPGQKVKVFSDYGWSSTVANGDGHWELEVIFDPPAGEKTFAVHAKLWDHPEHKRSFELTTIREGGEVAFAADNVYGECSEVEPYDVYHGTAQPGSVVKITSEYGSATVEANGDGHWEKKVYFDSPRETEFAVTVKSLATGESRTFSMYVGP